MSIQDRDWYREAWAEKEKKYTDKDKVRGKDRKKHSIDSNTNNNTNTVSKNNNETNTSKDTVNKTVGNKTFLGRVLDTKHENKMFYSRVVCGNCKYINTIMFSKRPKGRYEFRCGNCNAKVFSIIISHSVVTWILFIISLLILFFMLI